MDDNQARKALPSTVLTVPFHLSLTDAEWAALDYYADKDLRDMPSEVRFIVQSYLEWRKESDRQDARSRVNEDFQAGAAPIRRQFQKDGRSLR